MSETVKQKMHNLSYEEMISVSGGWGGGGSLGYAYTAAAHEMGDFWRGVVDGLSSLWK